MPATKYVNIRIGDIEVHVDDLDDLPVSIDYALEDADNFQKKKSAASIGLKIPATLMNDKAANTFRNADIKDMTEGEIFRSHQPCVIEANGFELLIGKAFLKQGTHNFRPKEYEYDIFGDNADWQIELQEKTLFDFLKHIEFIFDDESVISSWNFDGTNPNLPYVFAPVRYRQPVGGYKQVGDNLDPVEEYMTMDYFRPSISKYWILFWAFKSLGYRIQSDFLNTEYFRRQVMPWTWGNFLTSEGTKLNAHLFLAKSTTGKYYDTGMSEIIDLDVSNDSSMGGFDNNDDYTYDPVAKEMKWEYKSPHFGKLVANLSMTIQVDSTVAANSDAELRVQWFKNGIMFDGGWGDYNPNGNSVFEISAPTVGRRDEAGIKEMFCSVQVNPNDIISAKVYLHLFVSKYGRANCAAEVIAFQMDYFKIPIGGTIDFSNYTGFQKYKFLDFFRGVIDEFNLSLNTDPVNKVVLIEPTHSYSLTNNLSQKDGAGYFNADFIDWNGKEDLSKDWVMNNYSDYEREVTFTYKEDSNDGILKTIQDRHVTKLAQGLYIFPDRFKSGKKSMENRFFSPTMHYDVDEWKDITGVAPQMVCLIPENISNTSNNESANTFQPKSCYYKGFVSGVGGFKTKGKNGIEVWDRFPYMFAVNYKDGGENDPILSYSDERIKSGAGFVVGKGLLKRFFWQRLAIMRNGQRYATWFRLKNIDVANPFHREFKSYAGHLWQLIQIKNYQPLKDLSTYCLLDKWEPIKKIDSDNTFPSAINVLDGELKPNSFDVKYEPLKCLPDDIPR